MVIERCRRCGFDVPVDEPDCPGCGPVDLAPPPLVARHVAGLALPTRSVRPLPSTRPGRDRREPQVGPADGARSAFGYAVLFLGVTLAALALGWASRLQRLVFDLPDGTADRLQDVAGVTIWASVAGVVVGLLAMFAWTVRRVRVGLARRARRRPQKPLQPLPR